ncbi:MAG TPA: hypothetical protein VGM41_13700, partial [Chitinophagaceae bacterium]
MNINRHNYESFFLLYADNELTAGEKDAVEEFVQQNPDLERELALLQQSVFRPEAQVVFAGKEDLMRSEHPATGIHTGNYESFFLLYADNELKPHEKKTVEAFLDTHPQYQGELELLHAARMSPDASIVYEGKQDLYRREEKERVVVFAWWRLAAAAIVLMLLGLWWLNRPKAVAPPPIANNSGQNKPAQQPAIRKAPAPATAQTTAVRSPALTAGTNSSNKKKDKQQVNKNNNVLPQTNNLPPLHKMPDDNQQVAENIPEN